MSVPLPEPPSGPSKSTGQAGTVSIPLRARVFAFTSGMTFEEFLYQEDSATDVLRRRYDTVRLAAADQAYLATYPDWLHFVVVATDDSPDTLMVLPILARIAEACPRFHLRIVRDEDDLALLNDLVDDVDLGESAADLDLPLLFIFDEEWSQQVQWGPHPQAAENRLDEWLEQHPEYESLLAEESVEESDELAFLFEKLVHEMRLWYNNDLTQACISEIVNALKELQADDEE